MKKYFSAAVVLIFLIGLWIWPLSCLGLRDTKSDRWIWRTVVHPGDTFHIGYTHSVYQRPLWDSYSIDPRYRMILEETVFPASGYGLPFAAVRSQVFRIREDGNYSIGNIKKPIPHLMLRVQRQYGNFLTFNDKTILNLSSLVGDGVIEVKIHASNRLQYASQEIWQWLEKMT